jgi:hypothetical protein
MDTRIYAEDSVKETAKKIFYHFVLNQSCLVKGFVVGSDDLEEKGKLVLDELRRLDELENHIPNRSGKMRRRRNVLQNSIGGYVAQKIFRYKKETINSEVRYTIWRVQ